MSDANKIKIYLSSEDQEELDVIGRWYAGLGVDGIVNDKGAVNRSAVVRRMIFEKKLNIIDINPSGWTMHGGIIEDE